MPFSLLPSWQARTVAEITPAFLKQEQIRLLMLDFDNTIVPYTTDIPSPEIEDWFRSMEAAGIRLCVVSNSRKQRVPEFCRQRGIPCIIKAKKPFPLGTRKCLKQFGIPAEQTAMVGDQIFTDTLAGNLCGARSILVKPIHNHNIWLKARHVLEQPMIYLARKRRINHEEH